MSIDFKFISELEGNSLTGYVPDPDNSQSGVTIASGFDLGGRDEIEIRGTFKSPLADKLASYCGLKRQDAVDCLASNPLIVTEQEAQSINEYAHKQAEHKLKRAWSHDSDLPFDDLSDECQTVVASVAFQYGDLASQTPNFWSQACNLRWFAAVKNLRNFGDDYPTRRNKEAELLSAWLGSTAVNS